jgi:regulator of RNase E activity RraA
MANVGFRIVTKINRPPKELIQAFAKFPVPNIADNMGRMFCAHPAIKPFNNARLLGPAFTVRTAPGDNLMFHKALDTALPGDILVIDGGGELIHSLCGEIMFRYAMSRGLGGFVVDGSIRDCAAARELDFPIYARGVSPMGPYKNGPGEINVPICCGGVPVKPGFIVVGDPDGLVFIDPADAPEIIKKTQVLYDNEVRVFANIKAGTVDRSWVDKALKEKGCEILE